MTITEPVILDLLPLYFEGQASSDTKKLVEEYFESNPEFAERIKASFERRQLPEPYDATSSEDGLQLLSKTRNLLRIRTALLIAAFLGTLFPVFYFTFGDLSEENYTGYQWLLTHPVVYIEVIGILCFVAYLFVRRRMKVTGL